MDHVTAYQNGDGLPERLSTVPAAHPTEFRAGAVALVRGDQHQTQIAAEPVSAGAKDGGRKRRTP